MIFVLSNSLKKQALITIAVSLWDHDLDSVSKRCFHRNGYHFRQIKYKLIGHVQKLVLPKILKTELTRFVDGIGSELLQWFRLVQTVCKAGISAGATRIFWTPHGTIDLKRTVDTLVQDETIPVEDRYKLAYICCLEEHVSNLWKQLDKTNQGTYPRKLDGQFCLLVFSRGGRRAIGSECFNIDILPHRHGFYHSVINGIDTSVKYYLQKLAEDEECEEILLTNINHLFDMAHGNNFGEAPTHILCYLLNAMDKTKQKTLLEKHSLDVLLLFLNWPLQVHFMKLYECVGSSLLANYFYDLLNRIVLKRRRGYQDFDYNQIFEDVWNLSSIAYRRHAVERYASFPCNDDLTPCYLFELQDWKIFNLLLKDATNRERRKVIFHPKMCDAYRNVIIRGSYNAIECFVKECLVSRKDIIELKRKMEDCGVWYQHRKRCRRFNLRWRKFFAFLDSLIVNKRKLTLDGGNARKKRCVAKNVVSCT